MSATTIRAMVTTAPRDLVRILAALLLSIALFFPHFLGEIASLRILILAIGAFVLAVEVWMLPLTLRRRALLIAGAGTYVVVSLGICEMAARELSDRYFAVNSEHLFVMFPLFAVVGALILRSDGARIYLNAFLAVGSLVSVLAIGESLLGMSLLGREYEFLTSQREGPTRALVGAEHVLVLGATLAAAAPLAALLRPASLRVATSVLLLAGCWATGSRSPAAISTAAIVVMLVPAIGRFIQRRLWILYSLATATVASFAYLSTFVWRSQISGDTGLEYSANYRWASYSLIPRILTDHPLGYAMQATPLGEWVVDSELRGAVDIGRSADSEILFAVFGLGWIGVLLFLLTMYLSIAAIRHNLAVGMSSLTLVGIGFFLSLHGWDGMSPFWYALMGMCAFLVFRAPAEKLILKYRDRRPGHTLGNRGTSRTSTIPRGEQP